MIPPAPPGLLGTFDDSAPEVKASELVEGAVYILSGTRYSMSLNYAGVMRLIPGWPVHLFLGPRANIDVRLAEHEDGFLYDGRGMKIAVRKYVDYGPPLTARQ